MLENMTCVALIQGIDTYGSPGLGSGSCGPLIGEATLISAITNRLCNPATAMGHILEQEVVKSMKY
jgi:hypothetical protein